MKKIVIAMPVDEKLQGKLLEHLKSLPWVTENSEVDFVHIFKQEAFPYLLPPAIFPTEDQKSEITATLVQIFKGLTKDLPFKSKNYHIAYHDAPKIGMTEYLKDSKTDLVISLTKEKHGITEYFASSFTEYLIKHAPCNVLVLRD